MLAIEFFLDPDKSAAQAMGGEVGWFAGACDAVNFVLVPPDSHVRHTGQYRTNGGFIGIENHRILRGRYFADIISNNRIGVFRLIVSQEALGTDKVFGEAGAIGTKRKGKSPGVIDKGPGADILVGQGQHGTGSEGIPGGQPAGSHSEFNAAF